jgi:hypothetical protein
MNTPVARSPRGLRPGWLCAVSMILAATCAAARADESPMNDRFVFDVGSYFMGSSTSIRADELSGIDLGTRFRVEDVFGLEDETVFRLEAAWRFKPRHAVRLMYFDSARSGSRTLERDIEFGDESFPVGASATVDFDFTVTQLAYRYSLVKRDGFELDGSAGIHNIDFGMGIRGTLSGPGGGSAFSGSESASTNAPLPVIGIGMTWRMAGDVYLLAHAQYFQVEYGDIDGRLTDLQAGLLWQFSKRIGAGASYNRFSLDVGAEDDDSFRGALNWTYDGPQLFLRAVF